MRQGDKEDGKCIRQRGSSYTGISPTLIVMAVNDFGLMAPAEYARLYERLLHDIARRPLPERGLRCNPRGVKPQMSHFALKRPEHRRIRQPSKPFQEAIVLIRNVS